jgi:hypothetical protein
MVLRRLPILMLLCLLALVAGTPVARADHWHGDDGSVPATPAPAPPTTTPAATGDTPGQTAPYTDDDTLAPRPTPALPTVPVTKTVSGTLARWQAAGAGKWLSIYANKGHVYLEVAGLRLDTSPVGDPDRRNGVRWRPLIGRRAGFHARHVVGL